MLLLYKLKIKIKFILKKYSKNYFFKKYSKKFLLNIKIKLLFKEKNVKYSI